MTIPARDRGRRPYMSSGREYKDYMDATTEQELRYAGYVYKRAEFKRPYDSTCDYQEMIHYFSTNEVRTVDSLVTYEELPVTPRPEAPPTGIRLYFTQSTNGTLDNSGEFYLDARSVIVPPTVIGEIATPGNVPIAIMLPATDVLCTGISVVDGGIHGLSGDSLSIDLLPAIDSIVTGVA